MARWLGPYFAGTFPLVGRMSRSHDLHRNLRSNDSSEETPKYHAEGGLHIKVDMLTYRLFFVSRTEETYCRERTSQEVRQLDEQAKKTSSARAKAFDTWLASKTEVRQKQDDVSMEL